jgi:hypothetical protein
MTTDYEERDHPGTPKPQPGQHVRLTMRNYSAWMHAPKTWRLIGDVVNTPHWEDDPNSFALFVKGNEFPVRIIRMQDLLSINGEHVYYEPMAKRPRSETWRVTGSKGDTYKVTRTGHAWACTCAGYTFRQTCRHINEIRNVEAMPVQRVRSTRPVYDPDRKAR